MSEIEIFQNSYLVAVCENTMPMPAVRANVSEGELRSIRKIFIDFRKTYTHENVTERKRDRNRVRIT